MGNFADISRGTGHPLPSPSQFNLKRFNHLKINPIFSIACAAGLLLLASCADLQTSAAQFAGFGLNPEVEYRPGGPRFDKAWTRFYQGDHEAELSDPLIEAGRGMTPAIVEAIAHQDMKFRRYAIGALAVLGDRRALPQLEAILKNRRERDYFRSDALEAIYRIDKPLGRQYAAQYVGSGGLLAAIAADIVAKAPAAKATSVTGAERAEIINALRGPVEKVLKKQTVFSVWHLKVQDDWAFLRGVPQSPGGKRMDYRGTVYQEQIDFGAFDDGIEALLRKKKGVWTVVTYDIGATDVVWIDWGNKYHAPASIFQ